MSSMMLLLRGRF